MAAIAVHIYGRNDSSFNLLLCLQWLSLALYMFMVVFRIYLPAMVYAVVTNEPQLDQTMGDICGRALNLCLLPTVMKYTPFCEGSGSSNLLLI